MILGLPAINRTGSGTTTSRIGAMWAKLPSFKWKMPNIRKFFSRSGTNPTDKYNMERYKMKEPTISEKLELQDKRKINRAAQDIINVDSKGLPTSELNVPNRDNAHFFNNLARETRIQAARKGHYEKNADGTPKDPSMLGYLPNKTAQEQQWLRDYQADQGYAISLFD